MGEKLQKQDSQLHTESVMDLAMKYLTSEAQNTINKAPKAMSQSIMDEDGKLYRAIYFSCVVRQDELEVGINKITEIVNDLASRNEIYSILAPIQKLELASVPLIADRLVVFFFPLVSADKMDVIKNKWWAYAREEGGIGDCIGNFEKN